MRVDQVELRIVRVPFRAGFGTSYGPVGEKVAVLATVRAGGVEGYGEGVMDPLPVYREETIPGALALLREALVPSLLHEPWEGPAELTSLWSRWRGNPMAKATLEMAAWDCFARSLDRPLRQVIGGREIDAVAVGASLGIAPVPALLDEVRRHVEEGYRRIKLKIAPGHDRAALSAVRAEHPTITLSADANAAYTPADTGLLASLDDLDLAYLEQPLHWDDLHAHAELATRVRTPLCLDESLTSPERVEWAVSTGACAVINAKAGRLGGVEAVRRVDALAVAAGVPVWCGGMFETGVGRAHNIHLATLPSFVLPGDTASASRTYARDVVEQPLEATDGMMPVPAGSGIGVTLDRAFLDRVTTHVEVIRK